MTRHFPGYSACRHVAPCVAGVTHPAHNAAARAKER